MPTARTHRMLLGAVLGTSGVVTLGLLLASPRALASSSDLLRYPRVPTPPPEPELPKEAEPGPPDSTPASPGTSETSVVWFGGTGTDNREALGWMLASENPGSGELVWFLQALTANNVARGRASLRIGSIREMLQSGVQNGRLRRHLGWGPQYDKKTRVTRFASTNAALHLNAVPPRISAFVDDLLGGSLDPTELRGPAGESPPPTSEWSSITSYLQHRHFDQTVAAQLGRAGSSEAEVVASWGDPRLVAEVDGVRFYGRPGARRSVAAV